MPPPPTPHRPGRRVALGLVGLLVVVGGTLGAVVAFNGRPSDEPSSASGTSAPSDSRTSLRSPSEVSASLVEKGWTSYESRDRRFSLALPPSWSPRPTEDLDYGPYLRFAAWGFPVEKHQEPWLLVFQMPAYPGQVGPAYFEQQRLRVSTDPAAVSVSELREIQTSEGPIYAFTSVHRNRGGGHRSETLYGTIRGDNEYRLVFLMPLEQKDHYDFLFDDIARSLDVTDRGISL